MSMIFFERPKDNLTRKEQNNFSETMERLLFFCDKSRKPLAIPKLEKANIDKIGNLILVTYIDTMKGLYHDKFNQLVNGDSRELEDWIQLDKELVDRIFAFTENQDLRNEEYLFLLFGMIKDYLVEFVGTYADLAFAPTISELKKGYNCFGFTQLLGAFLLKAGFDVKLAISVNHPMCLIEIDEYVYFVSNYGIDKLPKNQFINQKLKPPYFIDLTSVPPEVLTKDHFHEKAIVVTEFISGVVYGYLEQLASFRAIELKEKTLVLPTNLINHTEIVEFLGYSFLDIDWSNVQKKIFPEIQATINQHATEFENDFNLNIGRYNQEYYKNKIRAIISEYYASIYSVKKPWELEVIIDNHLKKERIIFKEFGEAIRNYVNDHKTLPDDFPPSTKELIDHVLKSIGNQSFTINQYNQTFSKEGLIKFFLINTNQ